MHFTTLLSDCPREPLASPTQLRIRQSHSSGAGGLSPGGSFPAGSPKELSCPEAKGAGS